MKLEDTIKVDVSNKYQHHRKQTQMCVRDREVAGLQYIGGYILHKLHNNFRNNKT